MSIAFLFRKHLRKIRPWGLQRNAPNLSHVGISHWNRVEIAFEEFEAILRRLRGQLFHVHMTKLLFLNVNWWYWVIFRVLAIVTYFQHIFPSPPIDLSTWEASRSGCASPNYIHNFCWCVYITCSEETLDVPKCAIANIFCMPNNHKNKAHTFAVIAHDEPA